MKSPFSTVWPVGSSSSPPASLGKRLMGAYIRSPSLTTRWMSSSLPSLTSSYVGTRPPSVSTSAIAASSSGRSRLKWYSATHMALACVRCPAAMMSFTSPHRSSLLRGVPSGLVAVTSVSSRHSALMPPSRSARSASTARRWSTMDMPTRSSVSYDSSSCTTFGTPSALANLSSGTGVMKSCPMISLLRLYASRSSSGSLT
mmetsp:Transcript_5058/g.20139  ORF Transcript_5058/g.20139 Transcript_5058/m.20139 type:complete len:201 (-) Transcript_5058:1478-2080(-)